MYTNGGTEGLWMEIAVVSVDVMYRCREAAFGLVCAENKTLAVSSVFAAFYVFRELKKRKATPQITKKKTVPRIVKRNVNQFPKL